MKTSNLHSIVDTADPLAEAIRERSLSRREAARQIGIHESLLSKILTRKLEGTSSSTASKIAAFLDAEHVDSRPTRPHTDPVRLSRVFVAVGDPFNESLRPRLDAALQQFPSFSLDTIPVGLPDTEGYDAAIFIADTGARPTALRHPFVDLWISIQLIMESGVRTFVLIGPNCGPEGAIARSKIPRKAFDMFQAAKVPLTYFEGEDEFVLGLAGIASRIRDCHDRRQQPAPRVVRTREQP